MEGQKRQANTKLQLVARVDLVHLKVHVREGAASDMNIKATIKVDPSVGQREQEMAEAMGLHPIQPQGGSKIDSSCSAYHGMSMDSGTK